MFEKRTSEAIWTNWWTPHRAVRVLVDAGLLDTEHAVNWLHGRLKSGEIPATAAFAYWSCHKPLDFAEAEFVLVPLEFWHATAIHWKQDFWISGDFVPQKSDGAFNDKYLEHGVLSGPDFSSEFQFAKVRFQPLEIEEFCQKANNDAANASNIPTGKPIASPSRKGAKRKDWWDHLWIEMIRRIRAGTLKPKNQAGLLATLEDYVRDELSQEVGDSTLKPMAANLFKYLEEISGEIGEN